MNYSDLMIAVKSLVVELMPEIERRRYDIQYKSDNSPVTAADVFLEDRLKRFLEKELGDIRMIAEESFVPDWTSEAGLVGVLDPIDGTENFCSGLKEWGVSLGIWDGGRHQASLILLPELGLSLQTGQSISKKRSRITGFSSSFHPDIARGIQEAVEYRVTGCAVYNLWNVITGSFKRFVNPKGAYVWDLLPGLMLAIEQGCEVKLDGKEYFGEFVDPTRKYRVDVSCGYDFYTG